MHEVVGGHRPVPSTQRPGPFSDPAEVSQLAHRYAKIRAQVMSPDDSLSLIERLAGEER